MLSRKYGGVRAAAAIVMASIALSSMACSGDAAGQSGTHQSQPDAARADADASTGDSEDSGSDAARADASDADASAPEDVALPPAPLADGIQITDIQAFQTIETRLVDSGASADSEVPLVAGRKTLFRIFVTPDEGWTPRDVTAQLLLVDANSGESQLFDETRTVAQASAPEDRDTAFEIQVPAASITPHLSASFRLIGDGELDVEATEPTPARWPRDGSMMPLEASEATGTLDLVIVPIRYDSDGSGRMPDTSAAQLSRFEEALRALYPAQHVNLEVREAISWSGWMRFGSINRELRALKQADGADHAYYYGVIRPAETFEAYCSGSCTTGQSFTPTSAEATSYRVGSGLGFTGERWAWTLIHELGHMHGRGHAPCGVSAWSRDRSYPYGDGSVGVWGWDGRTDTLFGPDQATDFMGYCDDLWASDYTYLGIFERMREANSLQQTLSLTPPTTWRYVNWSHAEPPSWGRRTRERDPSTGEWARAAFIDGEGRVLQRTRLPLIRYAHHGERSVLVPEPPAGAKRIQVEATSRQFELELP